METLTTQDTEILSQIELNPERALRLLYSQYHRYVCTVIYKMIGDGSTAEDIAQEVFVQVWKKRESLNVNISLKGYLRRAAVNRTLNHLRSKKVEFEQEEAILHVPDREPTTQKELEAKDLKKLIDKSINSLPERCRIIFGLSRFEELSYREISESLGISVKTVENQMSKALKIIRRDVYSRDE